MLWDVYRSTGSTFWKDDKGRQMNGFETAEVVKTVEAPTAQEAIRVARSLRDPAPMVGPACA